MKHTFIVNGKPRIMYLSKEDKRYKAELSNGNSFSSCDYSCWDDFIQKAVFEFTYSINFAEKGYSFAKKQSL
jgi:hypothetical protein